MAEHSGLIGLEMDETSRPPHPPDSSPSPPSHHLIPRLPRSSSFSLPPPRIGGEGAAETPAIRTTPRTSAGEIDWAVEIWQPTIWELWVQFPGQIVPVLGWYRQNAGNLPEAFFASDGEVRVVAPATLDQHVYKPHPTNPDELLSKTCRVHPALLPSIRGYLRSSSIVNSATLKKKRPAITEKDWRLALFAGTPSSLPYAFWCSDCGQERRVQRMDSRIVESLPMSYQFLCRHVNLQCNVAHAGQCKFDGNPTHPPVVPPIVNPPPPKSTSSRSSSARRVDPEPKDITWRKKLKHWESIPKYEGSPSLVRLRGWRAALDEAFKEVNVPKGRDQVLAATHYLTGSASKWWADIVGQPLGVNLSAFSELYEALEDRFIPQDAEQKAMVSWNALRQRGTIDEYMRQVDELATAHPLGDVGEYWHAWHGLRPELKAEVKFALRERGRETCSRYELRKLLKGLEIKYPAMNINPRPFVPRFPPRQLEARVVSTSASPTSIIVCWICDRSGHRASECTRRKSTGCPRCGSKAHNLTLCPQRQSSRGRRDKTTGPATKGSPKQLDK